MEINFPHYAKINQIELISEKHFGTNYKIVSKLKTNLKGFDRNMDKAFQAVEKINFLCKKICNQNCKFLLQGIVSK